MTIDVFGNQKKNFNHIKLKSISKIFYANYWYTDNVVFFLFSAICCLADIMALKQNK